MRTHTTNEMADTIKSCSFSNSFSNSSTFCVYSCGEIQVMVSVRFRLCSDHVKEDKTGKFKVATLKEAELWVVLEILLSE